MRRAAKATERETTRLLSQVSLAKRTGVVPEVLAPHWDAYQQELAARDLLDFDDLVRLAVDALGEDAIAGDLRQRYRYVSIDEYQDVDEAQYRLVRRLAPSDANLCAIGDPNQAIYGFRGADVRFFRSFLTDFPDAREVHLSRNYRSTKTIVRASADLLTDASNTEAMRDGEAPRVQLHDAATERAEAEYVVHSIERMIGGHSFFSIDSGRTDGPGDGGDEPSGDLDFSDFAILLRTDALAEPVEEALARSGMPYQSRSIAPLLDDPAVAELMRRFAESGTDGTIEERIRRVIGEAGDDAGREALEQAFATLVPLVEGCGDDDERFLAEVALARQDDAFDPRAQRIALLTMHAAKGLEYRVVFIVGCEDGIAPLAFGPDGPDDPAEERRLFYVAATRAIDRLVLTRARRRRWRGEIRDREPSPYLADIRERLTEIHRLGSPRGRKPKGRQLDLFG